MAQAYVTLYGKVVLERDKLFLRSLKPTPFTETVLFRVLVGAAALALFAACFFIEDPLRRWVNIILSLFLFGRWVVALYRIIVNRSLSNRIPLSRIRSFSIQHETHGLDTVLTLHLVNGRLRPITFRTREEGWEGLSKVLRENGIELSESGGANPLQTAESSSV